MVKRIFILLILLTITNLSYADTVSRYFTYGTQSQVNEDNLNGNFDNIVNVLNGGLDNNNADLSDGFRFIEILSSLPASGNQGRVVFNKGDNTLHFDDGTNFRPAIVYTGTAARGTLIYYNGSDWTVLNAGTDGQALTTQGASNDPTFSGMTTQGDIEYHSGTDRTRLAAGTDGQVLETQGSGANPQWANQGMRLISTTSGSAANTGNITVEENKAYFVTFEFSDPSGTGNSIRLLFNNATAGSNYKYANNILTFADPPVVSQNGHGGQAYIQLGTNIGATTGNITGFMYMDTTDTSDNNVDVSVNYKIAIEDDEQAQGAGVWGVGSSGSCDDFRFTISAGTMTYLVKLYELD